MKVMYQIMLRIILHVIYNVKHIKSGFKGNKIGIECKHSCNIDGEQEL